MPPTRVSVVGGAAKGPTLQGSEKGGGLFFALNVLRRWWLIAMPVGLVLGGAGSAAVWLLFQPQYEAAAWLKIDEKAPFVAYETKSEESRSKEFFQTQIEMIRSPLVLGPVVERPEIARLADLQRKPDTIAWLAKQVKVSPVGESELFRIIYSSGDAAAAAAITNAITESYFKIHDLPRPSGRKRSSISWKKRKSIGSRKLTACSRISGNCARS